MADSMESACQELLALLAGSDDREAAVALVGLLRYPAGAVASWFAGAVVGLAAEIPHERLSQMVSRRIPDAGVIAAIVRALRTRDVEALRSLAGEDAVDMYVTLASVAAALLEESA